MPACGATTAFGATPPSGRAPLPHPGDQRAQRLRLGRIKGARDLRGMNGVKHVDPRGSPAFRRSGPTSARRRRDDGVLSPNVGSRLPAAPVRRIEIRARRSDITWPLRSGFAKAAERHGRRRLRQGRLLDEAGRRPDRVPRLPALLPSARRPARPVLRAARPRGRRGHGADRLRPLDRLLRRPDREEAAEPFPAGLLGAVVRHGRLQSRLRLLPELGHLQEPRDGAAEFLRPAGRRSRAPPKAWAAPASPTPTTIRPSFWNMRSTPRRPAGRAGSRTSQ